MSIFFNASLLLGLTLTGYNCMVYDYGSRNKKRGVPRALWYGLEFVRFALNWVWFGESTKAGTTSPLVCDTRPWACGQERRKPMSVCR